MVTSLHTITGVNGDATPASQEKDPKERSTAKTLSYETYRNMTNLLMMHMRREEMRSESQEGEEGSESTGLRRSAIVNWYLSEMSGELESEAELVEQKVLVEKVLDRLTYHVSGILWRGGGRDGWRRGLAEDRGVVEGGKKRCGDDDWLRMEG